jgi:hypothetical protein
MAGLVQLLSSSSQEVQTAAAGALRNLITCNQVLKQQVAAAPGAVEGLAQLLSSSSQELQGAAAEALSHLTANSMVAQQQVAGTAGAVAALMQLLWQQQAGCEDGSGRIADAPRC